MAVNLLGYTGDARLGIGSNPDIPVGNNNDLSVINNTMRDILLLDNQRNLNLFKQKIQDRDATNELIAKGQVPAGEILPQYRPTYEKAQQRVKDTFLKYGGNVINNPKAYQEYATAVKDLQDVAHHARANTVEVQKLQQEAAKELLPRKKEDILKHTGKQLQQDFWNPITPYQQFHNFNIDDILSGVNPITRTVQGQSPFETYDESYVDYNDILKNKRNQYINDMDVADSIEQFVDELEKHDPQQLGQTLDAVNKQLARYNQERKLAPGMAGYVTPIQAVPAQGRLLIKEPKTDLAAKWALAQQQKFSTLTPKFNKDLAKFAIDKEKLGLQARKLDIDAAKAKAYIRHSDAAAKKLSVQLENQGTNPDQWYKDIVGNIKLNAIQPREFMLNAKTGKKRDIKNKGEPFDAVFLADLPPSHRKITGPIINNKTGKITVGDLPGFKTPDGREYWIPKFVDAATGQVINPRNLTGEILEQYNDAKSRNKNISIDYFLKALMNKGGVDAIFRGPTGSADLSSIFRSAKTINALGTTKGEENIVNPPPSTGGVEEPNTEPDYQ